jgi:hypothetical protein
MTTRRAAADLWFVLFPAEAAVLSFSFVLVLHSQTYEVIIALYTLNLRSYLAFSFQGVSRIYKQLFVL